MFDSCFLQLQASESFFLYIITHGLVAFLSNTDTLWCVSLALIKALMCL